MFVSFILHPCIKLITNKLQPLPSEVPGQFIVGLGDFLIILVLHGTSISHVYLRFMEQLHELTALCSRPNLNET